MLFAAQREWFLEELERYIRQTEAEKATRINCTIPTMEEYRTIRMGDSSVTGTGVLLSLIL